MTTIPQLPSAAEVGPQDLLPLSQAGLLYSVSVATLTAGLQPEITAATDTLLGRVSTGAGGPEPVALGTGLAMQAGSLVADGADHAGFPAQAALSVSDDVIVNAAGAPARMPITALRGLFTAGTGIAIDPSGVIAASVSGIVGATGPQGAAGPQGAQGPAGAPGAAGPGLAAPDAANSVGAIASADFVAIWQNGANAWIPYGQLIGGQTIDQLPAAGPAADSDRMLVAQGSNTLASQGFGSIWTYLAGKMPTLRRGVVELTADTVLDGTAHNGRILVASKPLTISANFANMGSGFVCELINLASGPVGMGTGITSSSSAAALPPGGAARLYGLTYSGGSLVWWDGAISSTPAMTVAAIAAPSANTAFEVAGSLFNEAPAALDYSTDGGVTWTAASAPVITADAYSFTVPGLAVGSYTVRVRDHADPAVMGVSAVFSVLAPAISMNAVTGNGVAGVGIAVSGSVTPATAGVSVGLSTSATAAPASMSAAAVAGGVWSATVTPPAAGTVYVWAQETTNGLTAVSAAVSVAAAPAVALTINEPSVTTYAHGAGTIGLNGGIAPAQAASVQVALSTSNTVQPASGWQAALAIDGNTLWAVFAAVPAAAGAYYVWAQTASGGSTVVSAYTLSIT